MATMAKNFISWIEASPMWVEYNVKLFPYTQSACFRHWIKGGDICFQNSPFHTRISSCLFFSPKMARQGGWIIRVFHSHTAKVFPISLLKMLGQSDIIVRIPPTVGDRSLVDYPILITPPRYGAILDLALLAVAVRGWLSRPTLRFLEKISNCVWQLTIGYKLGV